MAWRHIIATLLISVCRTCATECEFFPDDLEPTFMLCQGTDITDFPNIPEHMKQSLQRIVIADTFIRTVYTLEGKEYDSLDQFEEVDNVIFDCNSLSSWFLYQTDTAFSTDCLHITFPTQGDVTDLSTEGQGGLSTLTEQEFESSQSDLSSPVEQELNTTDITQTPTAVTTSSVSVPKPVGLLQLTWVAVGSALGLTVVHGLRALVKYLRGKRAVIRPAAPGYFTHQAHQLELTPAEPGEDEVDL